MNSKNIISLKESKKSVLALLCGTIVNDLLPIAFYFYYIMFCCKCLLAFILPCWFYFHTVFLVHNNQYSFSASCQQKFICCRFVLNDLQLLAVLRTLQSSHHGNIQHSESTDNICCKHSCFLIIVII